MGDSYSSGNGTGTGVGDCVRSPDAFAPKIDPSIPGSFKFVACSGAQTGNITTSGQNGEARQVDNLTAATKYVTLNIGGNDAGFTSILTACAYSDCNADFDEAQRFIRDDLPARLNSVFDAIKARSPQTRIVLVGYPRLFSTTSSCVGDFLYSTAEKQRGNDTADLLAEVERRVTRENGYTFVDPRPAYLGHAVCEDEWINGFSISEPSGSFHPKQAGHASFSGMALAAILAAPDPTVTRGPRARVAFTSTRSGNDEVYVVNRDGGFPVDLTNNGASDTDPVFSPDGTKIAFASNRDGDYEIFVANSDGSGATQLTANSTVDREPTWAPDGAYLAYRSATGIVSMTSAGASPALLTANSGDSKPEWSPDGAEIAFGRSGDIYRMNADGQGVTDLTPSTSSTESAPSWAPSGLRIAFASTRTGAGDVYTIDPNGETTAKPAVRLTSDAAAEGDPVYSPDGTLIAFSRGTTAKLFTMTSAGASQTALTSGGGADTLPSWQADSSPPDSSFSSGPAGPTNQLTPSFALASTEPGSTFECAVDGGSFASCTSPYVTPSLAPGAHTVSVRATDPVGNLDPTPATRSFTVDTTPPDTTVNSGPSGATGDSTPTWTFSGSEPGSSFQCRIDGAAFAACVSPFTSPTLADGSHTFDVRAVDVAGNPDPTHASASFTVNTAIPDIHVDSAPGALTNAGSGSVAFSSPTATTFECSLDGAAFTACVSPLSFGPLADGSHNVRLRGTDTLGNTGTTELTFTVDTVAPDTSVTGGPAALTSAPSQAISFTSPESGMTFECRVDSSQETDFAACSSPFTRSYSDGAHTVEVRAVDGAGNRDATPASRTFTVDTAAPDTEITSHPNPAYRSNAAAFNFGFASPDGGPGATYLCRLDAEAWAACSSPRAVNVTGNGGQAPINGEHTFFVRASDSVGNADPTPAAYSFIIDGTVPNTSISQGPANNGWAVDPDPGASGKGVASFTFTAPPTEQNPVYECSLDNAAFSSCISPVTYTGLDDGSQHTFRVHALDAVSAGPDQTRTFTVDVSDPDTAVTGGPTGTVANSNGTFTYSAEPGVSFECAIDSGAFAVCPGSGKAFPGQADGPHTFQVRAKAPSGRTDATPATRTFTVDSGPPDSTITDGPSGPTNSAAPSFSFTSNEAGSSFACSVDSGSFASCTSPHTLAALAEGDHTFRVRATDAVGNQETSPASREFTVDLTAPDTTIASGPAGTVASATQSIAFASPDASASFQCSLDGSAFAACASPRALAALGEGAHIFTVRAIDAAGNADASPATRSFTVDTAAPDTTISSGPDGPSGTSTPSFTFTASEAGTFECRVDSGAFAACTSPLTLSAQAEGPHSFEVRAMDAAGNADPTPATRAFTVSIIGPAPVGTPRIITGSAKATKAGAVKLKLACSAAGPCAGKLTLQTAAKVQVGKRRVKAPLGAARFGIAAGQTVTVTVKLNGRAKSMLRAAGRIRAEAVTVPDRVTRKLLIRR